jgi:hypothetical protein
MIEKTSRKNQCFIKENNMLHKLLDALATSIFFFAWKEQLLKIIVWLLFAVFFQEGKKK